MTVPVWAFGPLLQATNESDARRAQSVRDFMGET